MKNTLSISKNIILCAVLASTFVGAQEPEHIKKRPSFFSYALYTYHAGLSYYCLYQFGCLVDEGIRNKMSTYREGDLFVDSSLDHFAMGPISSACQEVLALYSVQDFSDMIDALLRNYSQEGRKEVCAAILTQFNLYQFPRFIAALEQLPEFPYYIQELAEQLKNPALAQKVSSIQGFEKNAFPDFVALLVRRLHRPATEQPLLDDDSVSELFF